MKRELVVALGAQRYRVERPFGNLPDGPGRVTDVAIDAAGQVHVLLRSDPLVDAPAPCVITHDAMGDRLAAWGEDILADCHMIAPAPGNRLFVVDRDAHQIVICATNGQRLGGIGERNQPLAPFNHPTDVAFCPQGTIYVSDGYANARVHRFAPSGEPMIAWGSPGHGPGEFLNPHAIWVLPDGRVVVADRENNRLQVFSADGALLAIWTGFQKPLDIWGDAEGRLYVTDLVPSLSLLSPDGKVLGRCRPVLNGAHGICGDASGCLYLAEGNPSRVTRLVPIPS
jgi:sugar lactone lactonase YvrE